MNDEGRNLEYKCQVSRDEKFERSVVAFLNSREGGTIFVGIEDDGTVCGVANPDLVQRQVADRIRNRDRMCVFRYPEEPFKGGPSLLKGGPIKGGPSLLKGGLKTKGGLNNRAPSSSTVEFRIQIFEFLSAHPETTSHDVAAHFGSARSTIMRHLAHLKAAGVVQFVGSARNGHCEVCRENETNLANWTTTQVATPVTTQDMPPVVPPVTTQDTTQVTPPVTTQVDMLLKSLDGELDVATLQSKVGLKDRRDFMRRYILPALAAGLIERTIPEKPTSRFQKYRLTAKGRAALAVAGNEGAVSLKPSGEAKV